MHGTSNTGWAHRAAIALAMLMAATVPATVGAGRATADSPSGDSVQITSPANGAGVDANTRGYIVVSASGQLNPAQGREITSMILVVDSGTDQRHNVVPVGSGCAGQTQCSNSFDWTLGTNKSEQHTLQVSMTTSDGRTVNSPVDTVHLFSPTAIELSPPEPAEAGTSYPIMGIVTDSINGLPAGGASVTVRFTPRYGAASTQTTTTSSGGGFQVDVRATSNGTVSAVVNSSLRWGSSTGTISLSDVQVNVLCSAAHSSVRRGIADTITCKAKGLPAGVVATLSYLSGKKHVFYSHSKSTSSKVTFSFKMKKPGKYTLDVDIPANKNFGASPGLAKVTVK